MALGAAPCRQLNNTHTHLCASLGLGCNLLKALLAALACRLLDTVRLQGKRATSLNNVLSEARSAFRVLFGRCLLPGELLVG